MVTRRFLLLLFCCFLFSFTSCHVGRFFYWNYADLDDYKKFPAGKIGTAAQVSPIKPVPDTAAANEALVTAGMNPSPHEFLRSSKSVAFLVFRRDTLLYEAYLDGFEASSIIPSFSISKSVVSALVGIALEERTLESIHDPITKYLPELTAAGMDHITLEQLLNMRSGLQFRERYATPFSEMAKYYYGRHLSRYIRKLRVALPADSLYDYQSVNTLLVSKALERASGMRLDHYLQEKIWEPLGMEFDASWSLDSRKGNTIKSFCCLNARARDFARFGMLYLHNGQWNGRQIIPASWIEQTRTITRSSRDSQGYPYQYFWRVMKHDKIFAKGVMGQFIYIDYEKDIVIVRMGHDTGGVHWPRLFLEISKSL